MAASVDACRFAMFVVPNVLVELVVVVVCK
jgi:hypothetical protein